ncbi:sialidase family protein [Arcicella lustrica]|uniref:Sialidase family protein n=1 Tax=Arcicella lustrica TaxID=2984196 RepID=A0ABU5SMR8_9BACT|nr:sialidase family protein [Arcicella sp. DC25W]MEA5428596.1 sialidase family protein [Arcicella sp. DC25W]
MKLILFPFFFLFACACRDVNPPIDSLFGINSVKSYSNFQTIKTIQNAKVGATVFDLDNLVFRMYDGNFWNELKYNFDRKNVFIKLISDLNLTKPDFGNQIGLINNEWYIAVISGNNRYTWIRLPQNDFIKKAIVKGDSLNNIRLVISNTDKEKFAHDSKVFVKDDKIYVVYYCNDAINYEGDKEQKLRLCVINQKDLSSRKYFDICEPNKQYKNFRSFFEPIYTANYSFTKEGKIRFFFRVTILSKQTYCYRDFDPKTELFSEPQVSGLRLTVNTPKVEFNIDNILEYLKGKMKIDFGPEKNSMFLTSEPKIYNNKTYYCLTIGHFSSSKEHSFGTSVLLKIDELSDTFEIIGFIDLTKMPSQFSKQFVETAFEFYNGELIFIGRNDISGLLFSKSIDGGISFSSPISINEEYGYRTQNAKPLLYKTMDNRLAMIWNIDDPIINSMNRIVYGRNVMHIRICSGNDLFKNSLNTIIKSTSWCHYPSIFYNQGRYYLTITGDYRLKTKENVGDISLAIFNLN